MPKPHWWLARLRGGTSNNVQVAYHTTSRSFVAWWVGLLLMHCVNLCYYVVAALGYKSVQNSPVMFSELTLLSIGIKTSEYDKVSAIHATIAAIHAAFILLMVGSSLFARRLTFQPDFGRIFRAMQHHFRARALARVFSPSAGSPVVDAFSSGRTASLSARSLSRVTDSFASTGARIFSREGILGVDSVYFDHILLLRELLETGLQSYQVYRMSQLLPRLWLIRLYVALLVVNCWIVPLLHRYYRDRETTRRMLCLLCDAVLDVVSSIGISIIIFITYVPQYNDPNGFGFPYANWFNDVWVANMQQELQMMLVASWGDMVSRLVFALGLLQCMEAIKEMLTPPVVLKPSALVTLDVKKPIDSVLIKTEPIHLEATKEMPMRSSVAKASVVEPVGMNEPIDALPNSTDPVNSIRTPETTGTATFEGNAVGTNALNAGGPTHSLAPPSTAQHTRAASHRRGIIHFLVHMLGPGVFVAWGFVIIVIHLFAESHNSDAACELRLKPWLSTKPGCSIIEVNCHNIQSNGQDHLMVSALDTFDPERAARVTFRHCPALVITPKFREFKSMVGLKIYNSTVVSWDDNAALTSTDHPAARTVFTVRTYFPNGELPPGLLSNDFPPLVSHIIFCVTNLRVLPDDLDKKWAHGLYIALEHAVFTSIPDVVLRLQPKLVSVAGSPVTSVPAELFEIQVLECALLGYSRIQELPRNVTRVSPVLALVFLQQTNVTTFWSWMDGVINHQTTIAARLFNAYDTPYCREFEQIQAGTRSSFSSAPASDLSSVMDVSTPQKLGYARQVVDCTPGNPSNFPLALEDAFHALR